MLLSVVVPMYNESEGVNPFHYEILLPELKKYAKNSYEIIYVNDGSSDDTLELLTNIAASDKSVKVVNLSRNFGKEIATTAGISIASGKATIIMDGDGQHPPALIGNFLDKWRRGAQVVVGVRSSNQKEGWIKRWGSRVFYKLFNSASGTTIVPRSTDYRLIDEVVRTEFLRFTERHRITRGLIDWLGFKRDYISFDAPARLAGEASYNTKQLVKLAVNSFISLSLKPLFFFGWVGAFIMLVALTAGIFILVEQVTLGDPLRIHFSGSAILGILMAFLIGLVLISQAILATYVSHIYAQSQNRPIFVIDTTHSININKPADS